MKNSKAIVLDFGGVISRTLFETHDITEKALGLEKGSLTWRGPFAPETDDLWQAMQNDEISEREYWLYRAKETGQLVGETWDTMEAFVKAARGANPLEIIRTEFLKTLNIIRQYPIKLAVLSNELDLFYGKELRERLPFLADFDAIIDATYTHVLKPKPQAYQFVVDALDLEANQCVFLDDQIRNITGAQEFGMKTVHFDVKDPLRSYQQSLELLELKETISHE